MARVAIDPITRIEGHLRVDAVVEDGEVVEVRCGGTLFRGFEIILRGRDPRDAQQITQRVCGVCPMSHGVTATLALDSAFGIADKVPRNGRLLRNIILGANFIQSHILHFYHLAALDYVDITAVADYDGTDIVLQTLRDFAQRGSLEPFVPRYEGDYRFDKETNCALAAHYVEALRIRRISHEMLAVIAGKMPHCAGIVPGGVAWRPTEDKIVAFLSYLNQCREFIDNIYIPDVLVVAEAYPDYQLIGRGCGNYLAYGVFDLEDGVAKHEERKRFLPGGSTNRQLHYAVLDVGKITEEVAYSWFDGEVRHPSEGETNPNPDKEGAYSWLKAPRYNGKPHEVGPLARLMVAYAAEDTHVKPFLDGYLQRLGITAADLPSVVGRHLARALETKLVADAMVDWLLQLEVGADGTIPVEVPQEGEGYGITEAPRGALLHWHRIRNGKTDHYQLVVPTTWNACPADSKGQPGPIEQAILGTKIRDPENPYEIVRIVRSFDPCLACAVHTLDLRGRTKAVARVC
ncbi:MAG: nickel-dependent hydrogenase large subunit [Planctomycetota bacterium]|nr:MAG: nickel-dependent hydrogenase large subunit [Planctomycetota bacterium]